MRGRLLVAALCALAGLGCDDSMVVDDAPMDADVGDDSGSDADATDASLDADADAAAVTTCPASAVPGCHETCEFFYDCVVDSSLADRVEAIITGLGFTGEDFSDCSGCIALCEESTGSEAALGCFAEEAAAAMCTPGAGDPTVAASSVNRCCEGELDATFCQATCAATVSASDAFPVCIPFNAQAVPPECVGACPEVSEAMALGVDAEGSFHATSVAIADDGAFAVVGLYAGGTIDFGTGALAAADSPASAFLAVYDRAGAARFAANLGAVPGFEVNNPRPQFGDEVVFDSAGNVNVLSEFRGEVDLGAGVMASRGGTDVLLASYAPDGTLRWGRALGGPGDDFGGEIRALGTDLIFTADFVDSADFGGGSLRSAGGRDVLVASYDTDGVHRWSRPFGSLQDDTLSTLAVHPSGEYTLGAGLRAGADVGAGAIEGTGLIESVIARFAADGTLRWADVRGGSMNDFPYQSAANGEDVYVADYSGSADSSLAYGSSTTSGISWTTVAYDSEGEVDWAHHYRLEDLETNVTISMDADASGRLAVTIDLTQAVDFGGGVLTSSGGSDFAIVSFEATGDHRWSMQLGTRGLDPAPMGRRLASGELMVAGTMTGNLDYGSGVLTRAADRDLYFIRFAAE